MNVGIKSLSNSYTPTTLPSCMDFYLIVSVNVILLGPNSSRHETSFKAVVIDIWPYTYIDEHWILISKLVQTFGGKSGTILILTETPMRWLTNHLGILVVLFFDIGFVRSMPRHCISWFFNDNQTTNLLWTFNFLCM